MTLLYCIERYAQFVYPVRMTALPLKGHLQRQSRANGTTCGSMPLTVAYLFSRRVIVIIALEKAKPSGNNQIRQVNTSGSEQLHYPLAYSRILRRTRKTEDRWSIFTFLCVIRQNWRIGTSGILINSWFYSWYNFWVSEFFKGYFSRSKKEPHILAINTSPTVFLGLWYSFYSVYNSWSRGESPFSNMFPVRKLPVAHVARLRYRYCASSQATSGSHQKLSIFRFNARNFHSCVFDVSTGFFALYLSMTRSLGWHPESKSLVSRPGASTKQCRFSRPFSSTRVLLFHISYQHDSSAASSHLEADFALLLLAPSPLRK